MRPDQDQSCPAKVLAQILVTDTHRHMFHGYIVVRYTNRVKPKEERRSHGERDGRRYYELQR